MPQPNSLVQSVMQLPKVLFIRQRFSRFGGGELILDRTITALAQKGVPVSIIARAWEPRKGVDFISCDPPRSPRATRDSRFARAACALIAKDPDTLVQSHERLTCCDIFRAGDGVHAAYLAHRAKSLGPLRRFFQRISGYHRDVLRLEREMFASARLKAVIVNSLMVADEIVEHFSYPRERIHFIPNGIDLVRFSPDVRVRHRDETRNRLGIPVDAKVALFLGSGFDRKGLARAIEAVARQDKPVHLVAVGNDRSPKSYQAAAEGAGIKSRFHLVGAIADPVPFYAAADVVILPTIYDPFPSTVLEGLACGLPVVTTTTCGARDLAKALDPSLVCDALDREGLANGLRQSIALAGNPSTRDSARKIAEPFGIEPMAAKLLALYEKLLPAKP